MCKKFSKHFADFFYDLILYKINALNISLKKISHSNNSNSLMVLLF